MFFIERLILFWGYNVIYINKSSERTKTALDNRYNMVLLKNEIKTDSVASVRYNPATKKQEVTFCNGTVLSYNYENVNHLKNPYKLDLINNKIEFSGKVRFGVKKCYVFEDNNCHYYYIDFDEIPSESFYPHEVKIISSCLTDKNSKNVFEYLNQIVKYSNLKSEDGRVLLEKQYEKINFVEKSTVFASYLNPDNVKPKINKEIKHPIFPFGSNASQFEAVTKALKNQISIIEGPPGTGKTQTILNIIANLLIDGKTIQVVSNNNSATLNVLEKLAIYDMDFLIASLGSKKNKDAFIKNQTGKYPDMGSWNNDIFLDDFNENIYSQSEELLKIFTKQERLAKTKLELQSLKLEFKYFAQKIPEVNIGNKKISSEKIMELWQELDYLVETNNKVTLWFKLKSYLVYKIKKFENITALLNSIKYFYYTKRIFELEKEILEIETFLNQKEDKKLIKNFTEDSLYFLKSVLYQRYSGIIDRKIFSNDDFWKNTSDFQNEYPIVLSTTFSSISSLSRNARFDYIIMDESSQVDVATAGLALSCANNVVIVGDTKQLPNVVESNSVETLQNLFSQYDINEAYDFSKYSFLESISKLIPDIPKTMLREHYRCHPQIINFCNQKYYNNQLVIMTKDEGEENVLAVYKTVKGFHKRDKMSQRQVDVISREVLPTISHNHSEIGIIAPYNDQVDAIKKVVNFIDVATVHKFQGREKDVIILSTVDDIITDFIDNPSLINVAVSRAKKQLIVVASGNEQIPDRNITDLVDYIKYNNFDICESKINSVFDYLYSQYTQSRLQYLKKCKNISIYDSENLMHLLISEVLEKYTTLKVVNHVTLHEILNDLSILSDEEFKFALNPWTHLDFLIYNYVSKKPILAVEVDGFYYHKEGTLQYNRDIMKNHILDKYKIPLIRFKTNGSEEKEKLIYKLDELMQSKPKEPK